MRILAIAIVAAMATTSAMADETVAVATPTAPVMTGAINLDFAETTAGKTAGTMASN